MTCKPEVLMCLWPMTFFVSFVVQAFAFEFSVACRRPAVAGSLDFLDESGDPDQDNRTQDCHQDAPD